MGFGIMVLGCLFLATARYSGLDLLPDFIGFLILFKGISVADKYCDHFKLSKKLSLAGIIVSFVYFALQLASFFKLFSAERLMNYIGIAHSIFVFVFLTALFISLKGIAEQTDCGMLALRAKIGTWISPFLFLLARFAYVYSLENTGLDAMFANNIQIASMVAELLFDLYLLILMFSFYMTICLEGDEDMHSRKKSRIPNPVEIYEKGKNKYSNGRRKKK